MKCSRRSSTHLTSRPSSAGGPRHQDLLRPRVHDLHAEAAADVRGRSTSTWPAAGRAWPRRRPARRSRSGWRSRPAATARRRPSGRSTPLPSSGVQATALDVEVELQRVRGARRSRRRRRRPPAPCARRRCRARRRARAASPARACSDADHRRQPLVVDPDPLARRPRRGSGRSATTIDHRLADVVDHVAAPAGSRCGRGSAPGAGSAAAAARRPGPVQVLVGVDGDEPVDVERVGRRRCRGCGRARAGCARTPRRARRGRGRRGSGPSPVSSRGSSPRWTGCAEQSAVGAVTAALGSVGHAAPRRGDLGGAQDRRRRCSGSRCSGTGCRAIASRASSSRRVRVLPQEGGDVVRKPGVQKPHCSPWHSREGLLHRAQLAVGRRRAPRPW